MANIIILRLPTVELSASCCGSYHGFWRMIPGLLLGWVGITSHCIYFFLLLKGCLCSFAGGAEVESAAWSCRLHRRKYRRVSQGFVPGICPGCRWQYTGVGPAGGAEGRLAGAQLWLQSRHLLPIHAPSEEPGGAFHQGQTGGHDLGCGWVN